MQLLNCFVAVAAQLLGRYSIDICGKQRQRLDSSWLFSFTSMCHDLMSSGVLRLQAWGLGDEQLSCLFGLVKEVHLASVGQRLTIERSFDFFKDTLFNHSIQRCASPPFWCAVIG